jgi:hypothetical protein
VLVKAIQVIESRFRERRIAFQRFNERDASLRVRSGRLPTTVLPGDTSRVTTPPVPDDGLIAYTPISYWKMV